MDNTAQKQTEQTNRLENLHDNIVNLSEYSGRMGALLDEVVYRVLGATSDCVDSTVGPDPEALVDRLEYSCELMLPRLAKLDRLISRLNKEL